MQDSIFSPSFGNRPSSLVGRTQLLQSFEATLASPIGSRERATILLGQRGTGKTTLLWELADRAHKQNFVVATPTIVTENMPERIVEKIQEDAPSLNKSGKWHISGANMGALGFSAGLQFTRDAQETKSFQYKLTQLVRAINAKDLGVLILIDELQANSTGIKELVAAYQELVGERANIAMVLAGLPQAVSATLNDKVLTFLNRANKQTLEPLEAAEVDAFFRNAFSKLSIKITDADIAFAVEKTCGSPYMMQLVGHNIVLNAEGGCTITTPTVKRAIEFAQTSFENDICQTTLAALSDKDVDFLCAMSQDDASSSIGDIAKRMRVSPDYAQKYRKRLLEAGVIKTPRRGQVQFDVPYLKERLKALI